MTQQPYLYGNNNPLVYTDPSGKIAACAERGGVPLGCVHIPGTTIGPGEEQLIAQGMVEVGFFDRVTDQIVKGACYTGRSDAQAAFCKQQWNDQHVADWCGNRSGIAVCADQNNPGGTSLPPVPPGGDDLSAEEQEAWLQQRRGEPVGDRAALARAKRKIAKNEKIRDERNKGKQRGQPQRR